MKFVINYDYPNSSEDYIHRIGRTARSQKTGTAYTFFTPNNTKQAGDLVSVLREADQAINPKLIQMAAHRGGGSERRSLLTLTLQPDLTQASLQSNRLVSSVLQVAGEGAEVASRMSGVIGILGAGGAATLPAAAQTGTAIGDSAGGPKVALVA